jgi:NAD(P)-dependent dehydrogenase (short-subunit alcohol dehydrogenase family)
LGRNRFDLEGKCAVITGGTSGLGKAIALGLAEAGAHVVAASRRVEEARQVAAEILALGGRALEATVDVRDRTSVEQLQKTVLDAFGKVDILVNAAGITFKVPTLESSEEDWNRVLDVNLTGTLRACQVFGKTMVGQGFGKILNIASLSTFRGFNEVAAYAASKAAVGSLTKTLAIELAPYKICVNAIAPGVFPTALNGELILHTDRGRELKLRTPMKRFGDADELVGGAIYLVSDAASFVTGEILVIDGGFLASGVNQ